MNSYKINGITHTQKPLVLGQIKQLTDAIADVTIDMSQGALGIITMLGERLPEVLAVVLIPDGQTVKGRDLKVLAEFLEEHCELETSVQVIEDFFTCNPTASLLQRLAGAMEVFAPMLTGLKRSLVPSPEAISPSETVSSGE